MSNTLATGSAQSPGNQANQNGQNNSGAAASDSAADPAAVVQLSPEDIAAQAAADGADGGAAAANGQDPDAGGSGRPASERIREVIAERNATMEYANFWRAQALQVMQGGAAAPGGAPAGGATEEDPEPTLESFGLDATKWAPAHSAWTRREINRSVTAGISQAMTQASQQQATQAINQSYSARAAEFAKSKPDFAIATSNPNLPITSAMTSVIIQSEKGPDIAYHLATNPAECARISRLSPAQQAAAMGKLEAKFEKPATPAPGGNGGAPAATNRSRAPDPPNPTRAGGAPDINMRNCSLSEYLEQRLPQIAKMQGKGGGNTR